MHAWPMLIYAVTCAAGALVFLKVVADEIELTTAALQRLEEAERKAYKKRVREAAEAEVIARPAA